MLRLSFLVFALMLVACDSDTPDPVDAARVEDGGAEDGGAAVDAAVCTPPDDDPFGCEDLTPDPACGGSWVVGVTGNIQTAAGVGIEGARAQLCVRLFPDETLVCLGPPESDANGDFVIIVPNEGGLRCQSRAAMRAIAPRMPLATSYCPVELDVSAGSVIALADPYVLHPVEAATVPPVGDENAQREVTFADGLVLTLAPVDFPFGEEDYLELAGAPIDPTATACFDDGVAYDGVYVFNPETSLDAGAAVSIPNTAGLAPDTIVDLYVLGGLETRLLDGTEVEEGEVSMIGPATVSADGAMIVGGADSRVPYLSWLLWKTRE